MAIKNTAWHKIEPGQIVTFLYQSKGENIAVKRTVLCINPDLRYRKKNGRTVKFFIGLQLNRLGEKEIVSNRLNRILIKLGGLVDEDGAYGVDIDENINKIKTQQLVTKLRTEVDRYRTFNLRKCKTRRVFLETNYKQLPKKQIQQLEDMAEINED